MRTLRAKCAPTLFTGISPAWAAARFPAVKPMVPSGASVGSKKPLRELHRRTGGDRAGEGGGDGPQDARRHR